MIPSHTSNETPVFELKGSVLTIMVLHIKETDPDRLYPQLERKIGQARSFFNNAPLLIDVRALDEEAQLELDLPSLVETLRDLRLVPVGVRGGAASLEERALQVGLGLLPATRTEKTVAAPEEKQHAGPKAPKDSKPQPAATEVPEKTASAAPTMVITHPVRSGQQVIAQGDLVILSSVNAGAEVLAAGNIHVYGALRGRAMAGINGDSAARIFSLQCNPELVAVAGEYVVNDLLDKAVLNQSVTIALERGRLTFEVLGTFSAHT
jgi:septum site-determining protein MinC